MEMNLVIANIIFIIAILFLIFSIAKTFVDITTYFIDNTVTKSRLKQFNKGVKKDDLSKTEQVNSLTELIRIKWFPKLQKYMPSLKIDNLEELDKELKFIGWDDTFTAESYIAVNIASSLFGTILFLLLALMGGYMLVMGVIIFLFCTFILNILFKQEVKSKNESLFADFPELVRIVSGYLIAGMDLIKSMEESTKYISNEWKPILTQFTLNCNTIGTPAALDVLASTVDMFEVREFVSLVKLTIDQGGNAKDSFAAQADKISEMQKNQLLKKISNRKTMATIVQGPMLLCNMVVIALPTLMQALETL